MKLLHDYCIYEICLMRVRDAEIFNLIIEKVVLRKKSVNLVLLRNGDIGNIRVQTLTEITFKAFYVEAQT